MKIRESRGAKNLEKDENFAASKMYQKALQNKAFLATEKILQFTFWAKGQNTL